MIADDDNMVPACPKQCAMNGAESCSYDTATIPGRGGLFPEELSLVARLNLIQAFFFCSMDGSRI